jgi:hypothetical protein
MDPEKFPKTGRGLTAARAVRFREIVPVPAPGNIRDGNFSGPVFQYR